MVAGEPCCVWLVAGVLLPACASEVPSDVTWGLTCWGWPPTCSPCWVACSWAILSASACLAASCSWYSNVSVFTNSPGWVIIRLPLLLRTAIGSLETLLGRDKTTDLVLPKYLGSLSFLASPFTSMVKVPSPLS